MQKAELLQDMQTLPDSNLYSDRFWSKVNKSSGCWEWIGAIHYKKGYGQFRLCGSMKQAHRVSWLIKHGEWPALCVCHSCDNRKCVNPDHLFLGTNQDNVNDRVAKNRSYRAAGEDSPAAKLKNGDIIKIRSMSGSHRDVAKKFGVSKSLIGHIRNRDLWVHI